LRGGEPALPRAFGAHEMNRDFEVEPLRELMRFQPADVRTKGQKLRERSKQCVELAGSCVTDEAKDVFLKMASQYDREAEQLEQALHELRRSLEITGAA